MGVLGLRTYVSLLLTARRVRTPTSDIKRHAAESTSSSARRTPDGIGKKMEAKMKTTKTSEEVQLGPTRSNNNQRQRHNLTFNLSTFYRALY